MNKPFRPLFLPALALALLSGCFTLHRSETAPVSMTRAPEGRDVKVALTGFAATLTEYVPVYTHTTGYVDRGPWRGRRGRWHDAGGRYETVTTETLLPKIGPNDAFLRQAQSLLEESGFLVKAPEPAYTVDVAFDGPFMTSGQKTAEWAWMLCSVLSAEYSVQNWTAKLKVYDNGTGRVLFSRDYAEKFEDVVWSPLFFVGLAGYDENTYNFMQSHCLSALTGRAMADATAFLSEKAR